MVVVAALAMAAVLGSGLEVVRVVVLGLEEGLVAEKVEA